MIDDLSDIATSTIMTPDASTRAWSGTSSIRNHWRYLDRYLPARHNPGSRCGVRRYTVDLAKRTTRSPPLTCLLFSSRDASSASKMQDSQIASSS
jgi:hypothetical protein